MPKANRIIYEQEIVVKLIETIVKKIPGVSPNKPLEIMVNQDKNLITISFVPLGSIYNVYNVALEIQQTVYYKIKEQFDLFALNVNVSADK